MKIKFFSLFIFHLFITCTALCQNEELVDPKSSSYIKSYLGKMNNKDIYLVESSYINNYKILTCQDDKKISSQDCNGLTNLMWNGIMYKNRRTADYDIQYKEWFIYKNELYAISQKTYVNKVFIALKKFNSDLSTLDSTLLYEDSIKNYNQFNFSFKLKANQIGLFGTTSNDSNNFFTIIFNLDNKKLTSQKLDFKLDQKFSCSDFTFNDKHELMVVLEGEENLNNGYRGLLRMSKIVPTKLKSIIAFISEKNVYYKTLDSNFENQFVRSYKFYSLSDDKVLLGALTFSAVGGMNFDGYQISTWNYNDSISKMVNFYKTKNLDNAEFWLKPEFKKLQNNGYLRFYHFQFLKEIRQLDDGSFIFISEGIYSGSSSPTSGYASPTNVSSNSASTISVEFNNVQSPIITTGDIVVSKIDIKENNLIWSAKTKKRYDDFAYSYGAKNRQISYLLTIDKDQIVLYYPENVRNFDEFGNFKEKYCFGLYLTDNTIAKFQIFLSNGTSYLKEYKEQFGESTDEFLLVKPSHVNESNELVLISQKYLDHSKLFQYKIHIKQK